MEIVDAIKKINFSEFSLICDDHNGGVWLTITQKSNGTHR